jgi:hypothetical protein
MQGGASTLRSGCGSAVVEIALDDLAVDLALGKRARAVCARVIGDVVTVSKVEHGEDEAVPLDLDGAAFGDLFGGAKLEHRLGHGVDWILVVAAF